MPPGMPDFAVDRKTLMRFFRPPVSDSTFYKLQKEGYIVPVEGVSGPPEPLAHPSGACPPRGVARGGGRREEGAHRPPRAVDGRTRSDRESVVAPREGSDSGGAGEGVAVRALMSSEAQDLGIGEGAEGVRPGGCGCALSG